MEVLPLELARAPLTPAQSELTRAFCALVDELQLAGVDWALWHLAQLRDLAADPVVRVELEAALRHDAELRDEVTSQLDVVGEIVADAGLWPAEGPLPEGEAHAPEDESDHLPW